MAVSKAKGKQDRDKAVEEAVKAKPAVEKQSKPPAELPVDLPTGERSHLR